MSHRHRSTWAAVAVVLTVALGACGDDDDTSLDRSDIDATTTTTIGPADTAEDEQPQPTAEETSTTTTTTATTADPGTDATVPADLAGPGICERLPADVVASALGVQVTAVEPSTSATPQCSYAFETADGVATDATVAVLRPDEDLDGRTGEEAFDYVVDLNTRAAGGNVTESAHDAGSEAVVLTGENLHFGVVRYDARIVTVILRTDAGDVGAARALLTATEALTAP